MTKPSFTGAIQQIMDAIDKGVSGLIGSTQKTKPVPVRTRPEQRHPR